MILGEFRIKRGPAHMSSAVRHMYIAVFEFRFSIYNSNKSPVGYVYILCAIPCAESSNDKLNEGRRMPDYTTSRMFYHGHLSGCKLQSPSKYEFPILQLRSYTITDKIACDFAAILSLCVVITLCALSLTACFE